MNHLTDEELAFHLVLHGTENEQRIAHAYLKVLDEIYHLQLEDDISE